MYSPEFRMLLQACRLCGGAEQADDACEITEREKPCWDDLFARATFHRIEPQFLSFLERTEPGLVPETEIVRFREAAHDNLVRQLSYISEFFRVSEWLSSAGVEVIPFKGFWLGESAYGDIGARVSSDIDLFIDLGDLDRVREIMTLKGYEGHYGLDRLTDEYIRREMAEYNFGRYDEGVRVVHIEFHWRSAMTFYGMDISLNDLSSQLIKGSLQGHEVSVFSPAANLLLAVMHHGGKECYWQLRQVLDIAHLIRMNPDLDTPWLFRQAERFHVTTLLLLGVRLAHELTGVEVPKPFDRCMSDKRLGRMARNRISLMALPPSRLEEYRYCLASWMFKLYSRDGLVIRTSLAKYILRKVIAPRMVPEQWRQYFFNRKIRRQKIG